MPQRFNRRVFEIMIDETTPLLGNDPARLYFVISYEGGGDMLLDTVPEIGTFNAQFKMIQSFEDRLFHRCDYGELISYPWWIKSPTAQVFVIVTDCVIIP